MSEGATAATELVYQLVSVWQENRCFLMTCLNLNVLSCLPEERMKWEHFLLQSLRFTGFYFFGGIWLGSFCSLVECMRSRCMCGASVYEWDFFFLSPLLSPVAHLLAWIMSTVDRGAECSLPELRPAVWAEARPRVPVSVWTGEASASLWASPGWWVTRASLPPFSPTPRINSFKSYKQIARRECRRWNDYRNDWTLQCLV